MVVRTLCAWFVILLVAIISGGLRDTLIRPRFGDFAAELFGAVVLSTACFVAALPVMRGAGSNWQSGALRTGSAWLMMTVVFEFGFFHYVGGHSWSELLSAYQIWAGRLWLVVLISTFIAPFVAGRWLAAHQGATRSQGMHAGRK